MCHDSRAVVRLGNASQRRSCPFASRLTAPSIVCYSTLSTFQRPLTHYKRPGEDRGSTQGVFRVIKNQEGVHARGHSIEDQGMRWHVNACA